MTPVFPNAVDQHDKTVAAMALEAVASDYLDMSVRADNPVVSEAWERAAEHANQWAVRLRRGESQPQGLRLVGKE